MLHEIQGVGIVKWFLTLSLALVFSGCVVQEEGGDPDDWGPADSVLELSELSGRSRNAELARRVELIELTDVAGLSKDLAEAFRESDIKAMSPLITMIAERLQETPEAERPVRWQAIRKDIADGLRGAAK